MANVKRAKLIPVDDKSSATAAVVPERLRGLPAISHAATQIALVTAVRQLSGLIRFGSDNATLKSKGALQQTVVGYLRATLEIRAKAALLGYGPESKNVPITGVPGGYVGRFGGNDIYAATE